MHTTLCGSLSRHPSTLGASMHRAAYAALGLNYVYLPFGITDIAGAIAGMRALGIRGFGVSMPYKLEVIPLLDALHPLAKRIGAVNTVVNDGGRLTGLNTDAVGARRALEEHVDLSGKSVVVIGAGGAARAVAFALVDAGARVHIVNRTRVRADALATTLRTVANECHAGVEVTSGSLDDAPVAAEILINTSAAGMSGVSKESPVHRGWLESPRVVMDIVYRPTETSLLDTAHGLGKITVHGARMLLFQAAAQFELYTGYQAPLPVMESALRAALGDASA